jgi:sulfur-oxidizing protein SoxY
MSAKPTAVGRRALLAGAGAVALAPRPAAATPEAMEAAIRALTGGARPREGRVTLEIPTLVENGNAVPLTVSVESPMTAANHVTQIHVLNQKNPEPQVASFTLGPKLGRARIATRIRLADSQTLVALARTSDGAWWSARADVIVTLAACLENDS